MCGLFICQLAPAAAPPSSPSHFVSVSLELSFAVYPHHFFKYDGYPRLRHQGSNTFRLSLIALFPLAMLNLPRCYDCQSLVSTPLSQSL